VHFLDLIVEFGSLKDLQSISENVKDLIRLDFSVPRLNERFIADRLFAFETELFGVESLYLFVPLSLDDLDNV
jgi:hypothetical protein